ncbi:hypothetical protein ABW19_dt0206541 [Dactylella cylindrospora]|nr:hypothetical protein ABW19_dt0206541 [Dactylella cylindrospora]
MEQDRQSLYSLDLICKPYVGSPLAFLEYRFPMDPHYLDMAIPTLVLLKLLVLLALVDHHKEPSTQGKPLQTPDLCPLSMIQWSTTADKRPILGFPRLKQTFNNNNGTWMRLLSHLPKIMA